MTLLMKTTAFAIIGILVIANTVDSASSSDPVVKAFAEKFSQVVQQNQNVSKYFSLLEFEAVKEWQAIEDLLTKFLKDSKNPKNQVLANSDVGFFSCMDTKQTFEEFLVAYGELIGSSLKAKGQLNKDNVDEQASKFVQEIASNMDKMQMNNPDIQFHVIFQEYKKFFVDLGIDVLMLSRTKPGEIVPELKCKIYNIC